MACTFVLVGAPDGSIFAFARRRAGLAGRPPLGPPTPTALLGRDVFADGDRDGVYAQDSGCAASSTVELMS